MSESPHKKGKMLTLGKPFVTPSYQAFKGNETNACWHKTMRIQLLNNY